MDVKIRITVILIGVTHLLLNAFFSHLTIITNTILLIRGQLHKKMHSVY